MEHDSTQHSHSQEEPKDAQQGQTPNPDVNTVGPPVGPDELNTIHGESTVEGHLPALDTDNHSPEITLEREKVIHDPVVSSSDSVSEGIDPVLPTPGHSLDAANNIKGAVKEGPQNSLDADANRRKLVFIMTVGSMGVISCMIAHHFFLSSIDGLPAGNSSQFWIKNASNAISQIVVIFMTLVAGSVLNQVVWRKLSLDTNKIEVIDELFSLPSPLAIFKLVFKYSYIFLVPVQLALLINAFVVVSILAPNAVDVQTSRWRTINATIPHIDISALESLPYLPGSDKYSLVYPAEHDIWDSWEPPSECETDCSIVVHYQAPRLACRDLQQDELTVHPYSGGNWTVFDTTIFNNIRSGPRFSISYAPSIQVVSENGTLTVEQTGDIRGVQCSLGGGTFTANLSLISGVKHASTVPTLLNNDLSDSCPWIDEPSASLSCHRYITYASYLSSVIMAHFATNASWAHINETSVFVPWSIFGPSTLMDIPPPFNATITNETSGSVSFGANSSNVTQYIMEFFDNVVLIAMLSANKTETGSALILDRKPTWEYEPRTLWLVYGISLLLFLTFVAYGLYRGLVDGFGLLRRFSTILLRTREKELNDLCNLPENVRTLEYLRLDTKSDQFRRLPPVPDSSHTLNPIDESTSREVSEDPKNRELLQDRWAKATILGAFVAAVVLSAIHYAFLFSINGRNVNYYSQFWIRVIGNGLAQGVALCLVMVATFSLTHVTWRSVRIQSVPIVVIDRLFALPNPEATFSLFKGFGGWSNAYPIIIAATTYIIALVSILAPNTLTIGQSNKRPVQLTIPQYDYSQFPFNEEPTRFQVDAANVHPESSWGVPSNCGTGCAYEFEYEAPAISCVDIDLEYGNMTTAFRGYPILSILRSSYHWLDRLPEHWGTPFPYDFSTNYVLGTVSGVDDIYNFTTRPRGSVCECKDGLYKANFQFSNRQRNTSVTLSSYNNSFTKSCPWGHMSSADTECQQYADASTTICNLYGKYIADYIFGFMYRDGVWEPTSGMTSRSGSGPWRIFDPSLTTRDQKKFWTLGLKVENVSEEHVKWFSDFTLNLITAGGRTTAVNGSTWEEDAWKFNQPAFWSVYGIAHAWMLLIVLYGLYCIHDNGMAIQSVFSNIMLATRTDELDHACTTMSNHEAVLQLKLYHEKKAQFVIDNQKSDEKMEEIAVDRT